jgi:hypothetical protein
MRHYLIFEEYAHPNIVMECASSITEALKIYILNNSGVDEIAGAPGTYIDGKGTTYSHELQVIECTERALLTEWTIKEIKPSVWRSPLVECFHGPKKENSFEYVHLCREKFGKTDKLPTEAFIWELESGPLVTFFRRRHKGRLQIKPQDIAQRFVIPWSTYPLVLPWTGDYDQLVGDLKL